MNFQCKACKKRNTTKKKHNTAIRWGNIRAVSDLSSLFVNQFVRNCNCKVSYLFNDTFVFLLGDKMRAMARLWCVNKVGWHLWVVWAALWVSSFQSEIHSWLEWQPEHLPDCRNWQNLHGKECTLRMSIHQKRKHSTLNKNKHGVKELPKHLLWLVALSMKTLELMTLPKGRNICINSASPNSWGKW